MQIGTCSISRLPMKLLCNMSLLLGVLLAGCTEEFQATPPFPQAEAKVQLDMNDFVSISREGETVEGQPVFPFSYQIFDEHFEGYLANAGERLYSFGYDEPFGDRIPFFDFSLQPGDTLHKFTPRKYHILIDRRKGEPGEDIFFLLRRTRRGISELEERQVWVISSLKGVIAVTRYEIDPFQGNVTLDMIGDSEWFRDKSLTSLLKYHDYTRTVYMDIDRSLLYEFNKVTGILKCRDVKAREEIYRYHFQNRTMKSLVNFHIDPQDRGVVLVAEDSCFYFNETLTLTRSGMCP